MDTTTPGRSQWLQLLGSAAAVALAAGLIWLLPAFVGVSWGEIGSNLANVSIPVLVALIALWFIGLLVHAPVLMAAMPGLTVGQALTLNMSGSAVSNVLPLGGPAGMGLGYAMARSWGFRPDSYAAFMVSTNLWNMAGRFLAGISILSTAALLGAQLPSGLGTLLISSVVVMTLVIGTAVAAFRTPAATAAFGGRLDALVRRFRPGSSPTQCTRWLLECREELLVAVRAGWRMMSLGVAAYLFLQGTLLYACLDATGAAAPVSAVAITFAIERLISLAPITPGAAGVAEVGAVAALTSLGVDPVSATAGVLLYRILMFAIDIPVGGLLAANWLLQNRRTALARHLVVGAPSPALPLRTPVSVAA